jgi:uncharacterized repeat protein (TIGR01451 family)
MSLDLDRMGSGVGLKIRDNSFINNSGPGISHTVFFPPFSPTSIDGRGNWWGDPAGPNGPSGDGVSAGVVTAPWITTEPTAVVSVTKRANWSGMEAGGELIYTIVVENDGLAPAWNLFVVDTPMSATVKSASGTPVISGNVVTWTFPALGSATSFTYTLTATIDPLLSNGDVITNTVQVSTDGGINESASFATTIMPLKRIYLPLVLRNY